MKKKVEVTITIDKAAKGYIVYVDGPGGGFEYNRYSPRGRAKADEDISRLFFVLSKVCGHEVKVLDLCPC